MVTNVLDTLLKDGAYVAVVTDLKPKLLEDLGCDRRALHFTIKIGEGPYRGRLVTIELLIEGSKLQQPRVDHDIDLLDRLRQALGIIDPAPTWPGVIEECRAAAVGKRLEFTLWRKVWNGKTELRLSSVKVLGDG
jgi:hypothetical protein